jgi:hypothetical protein
MKKLPRWEFSTKFYDISKENGTSSHTNCSFYLSYYHKAYYMNNSLLGTLPINCKHWSLCNWSICWFYYRYEYYSYQLTKYLRIKYKQNATGCHLILLVPNSNEIRKLFGVLILQNVIQLHIYMPAYACAHVASQVAGWNTIQSMLSCKFNMFWPHTAIIMSIWRFTKFVTLYLVI